MESMKTIISKEQIASGIASEKVRFIVDPNMERGTVCTIGDDGYWFYFGGTTAEEENPEGYLRKVPIEDVVSEVFAVLEDFRKNYETFGDEYAYYAAILGTE